MIHRTGYSTWRWLPLITSKGGSPKQSPWAERRLLRVTYAVLAIEGPAHERFFSCAAQIDGEELGTGTSRTKKDAEQAAAKMALAAIGATPAA